MSYAANELDEVGAARRYRAVEAKPLPSGRKYWLVYQDGALDPISKHFSERKAREAIRVYEITRR